MPSVDPQEIADRSAQTMWASDHATKWLGAELVSVAPGQAVMTLKVQDHHLNGHGICHGGVIFALADSAFAFACNSYNRVAVAQNNSITYLAPGQRATVLTARAVEVSVAGRSGLYDVAVTDDGGTLVAEFRGHSRIIRGVHFELGAT